MLPAALHPISNAITIGALQTNMGTAITFNETTAVGDALQELYMNNFDQAPVTRDGIPIGYVLRSDLKKSDETVESRLRQILPSALVGAQCPLEDALPALATTRFLFVLSNLTISGFVVPSDLNRQAGRAYFSLSLVSLELELAEIVRELSREVDVLALLPSKARSWIKQRVKQRMDADVEADVVAEMTFSHLFRIIQSDSTLLDRLGYASEREWSYICEQINELRNRIAHPTKPLLTSQGELPWVVDIAQQTQELLSSASEVATFLTGVGTPRSAFGTR